MRSRGARRRLHGPLLRLQGLGLRRWMSALVPAGVALVALALRWPFALAHPTGWDAVDFALALERYDLTAMQPHFPGYPVFIWLGAAAHRLIADPFLALSRLSAVAGAMAVGLFARLAGEMAGWRAGADGRSPGEGGAPAAGGPETGGAHTWFAAAMTGAWLALSPLAWLVSEQPMSDAAGLLGTGLFLLAAWRYHRTGGAGRAALAAFLLGLTLGVRLSYFPLALTLAALVWMGAGAAGRPGPGGASARASSAAAPGAGVPGTSGAGEPSAPGPAARRARDLLAAAAGGLAGTLPWLLWQLAQEGPDRFLTLALQFTGGHLTDWGGAVGAAHAPAAREALLFWRNWLGLGLGGPAAHPALGWLPLAITAAGLWWGRRHPDRRFLLAWLLPYLAWAWWGQNPANPRHLLPLLPWAILVAATGWARQRPALRWTGLGALTLTLALIATPLVLRQQEPPPVLRLARHLQGERAPVFTWEEERVIRRYAPGVTVHRLRRLDHFRQVLLAYPRRARILATSAFLEGLGPEGEAVRRRFRPIARFDGDPRIHTTYGEITLYEAGPDLYDLLLQPGDGTSMPGP